LSRVYFVSNPGRGFRSRVRRCWGGVVSCHFWPDGDSIEQSIVFSGLDSGKTGHGADSRETNGLCSGSITIPTPQKSHELTGEGAWDGGGGFDSSVFWLGIRRIKGFVCLMRRHACISMLQAGGKTSSAGSEDCPLKNRGPLPSLQAVTTARDRSVSSLSTPPTTTQRRLSLTCKLQRLRRRRGT
jgi:hypothetical protein